MVAPFHLSPPRSRPSTVPSSSLHRSTAPSLSLAWARLCGTCETPPRLELPLCVVVFCLREPSCAMLLPPLRPGPEPSPIVRCHMEVSSNNGDKPVLTLFPDLLRHPAGTKRRNNYYPNYPGRLCLVIVWRGLKGGGGVGSGLVGRGEDTVGARPKQKETTKGMVSSCLIHCVLACLFPWRVYKSCQ